MRDGSRLHRSRIDGRGAEPGGGAFGLERSAGPDGVEIVALSGELDIAAVPAVRDCVDAAAGIRAMVVDLVGTTFLDSSMLKELLRANVGWRYETRLVIAGVPPAVRRLFALTRTAELFSLAEDRDAALAVVVR